DGARQAAVARAVRLRKRRRHEHRASARLLRDDRRTNLLREHRGGDRIRHRRPGRGGRARAAAPGRADGRMVPAHIAPAMTSAALSRGLAPARHVLDNGVVVLAQESGATPAVAINATFLAGSADEPADLPGVAYLARRTIDRGTTS